MRSPRSRTALLAVTLALAAGPAAGPAQAQPPGQEPVLKRLILNGRDGRDTYFTAVCRGGERTTVVERSVERDTCVNTLGGKRECRSNWRLMDAGATACAGTGRS